MHWRVLSKVSLIVVIANISWAGSQKKVAPPPNAPARVEWSAKDGKLSLRYHGTAILDAAIGAEDAGGHEVQGVAVKLEPTETLGDKVEQRLKFVPAKPQEGVELVLRGTAIGSEEAFPAETLSEAQERFRYVRNSVGLSRNLRNNAVYDRRWDWVLLGPADGRDADQADAAREAAVRLLLGKPRRDDRTRLSPPVLSEAQEFAIF